MSGVGGVGWGRLGVIIKSNLNRVRLSCCWVGVGLGCDNNGININGLVYSAGGRPFFFFLPTYFFHLLLI